MEQQDLQRQEQRSSDVTVRSNDLGSAHLPDLVHEGLVEITTQLPVPWAKAHHNVGSFP